MQLAEDSSMSRLLLIAVFGLAGTAPCVQAKSIKTPPPVSLGQDFEHAAAVIFGYAANPNVAAGTTEIHIEKVLKELPLLKDKKMIVIDHLVAVPNPKEPPRLVVFCEVYKGKLEGYRGHETSDKSVVAYLCAAPAQRAKGKVAALSYYAKFLVHKDQGISADAYLEFAQSTPKDICTAAKTLDPVPLRALLREPEAKLPALHGLAAFLLGGCGDAKDAANLRERI